MAGNVAQYLAARASAMGLDPQAVLAVAHMEGLGGGVGDHGTSFGPFQLHEGGALPRGIANPQQWATSPAGLNYALQRISGVARGEKGAQAVRDIVSRFERPANPEAEIAGAMQAYGGPAGASPKLGAMQAVLGNAGGGSQNQLSQMLLAQGMQALSGQSSPEQQGQTLLNLALARKAMGASAGGGSQAPLNIGGFNFHGVKGGSKFDTAAVKLASSFIGTPYEWGGASPGGFDCSGLLQYTWGKLGVNIPRTSEEQFKAGQPVAANQLRPGDAVFFQGSDGTPTSPGHVAMYIGGGRIIQSPHTGAHVEITNLKGMPGYMGARRYR